MTTQTPETLLIPEPTNSVTGVGIQNTTVPLDVTANQPIIDANIPTKPNMSGIPSSYAGYPGAHYIDPITKISKKAIPSKFIETLSYVGQSKIHGLGCFAKTNIQSGQFIEEVGAIILDTTTKTNTDYVITRYLFTWPCEQNDSICNENGSTFFVPTGNAMIYNHSDNPNTYWIYDKAMKRLFLSSIRDITEGEELTWYYGHGYAERLRKDPTGEGQATPANTQCSSCEERKRQIALQQQRSVVTHTKQKSNINRSQLFSGISPQDNNVKTTENLVEEPVQFRSMVVPENKINDTIQDGPI